MDSLFEIIRRIVRRLPAAVVIFGLALVGCAVCLSISDGVDFAGWRQARLGALKTEGARLHEAMAEVSSRVVFMTASIATEQQRILRFDNVLGKLKALDSNWDQLMGNPQQRANRENRARLEEERGRLSARVAALRQEVTRAGWERDGLEIDLAKTEAAFHATEADSSKIRHYLARAWNLPMGWLKFKWWLAIFLVLYLLVPTPAKSAASR
ncbi:MAG: hypothetical protein ABI222_09790 [Opitutaceae bacterium]